MPGKKATFGESILHGAGSVRPRRGGRALRNPRRILKLYWHWCKLMLLEVLFARLRSCGCDALMGAVLPRAAPVVQIHG